MCKGECKAVLDTEPEPEEDHYDEVEYVEVSLPEGDGELSEPVDDSVWNKNFISEKALLHWKTLKGKQFNPALFERPLNFEAVRKDFLSIVQKIERYGWTRFSQRPKGEANVTLVQELYANWNQKG